MLNLNMNIVITESKYSLIRRHSEIEEKVNDFLLGYNITPMDTFDSVLIELSWNVASEIAMNTMDYNSTNYVTFRNQLIRYIKNHYYSEVKEYFDKQKN
jgi:hypothetical protein